MESAGQEVPAIGPALLAEIEKRRQVIADIDLMLVSLLNRRQAESIALQMFKRDNGLSRKDPEQERRVIDRIRRSNPGPMLCERLEGIYRLIFNSCTEEG